MRRRSDDAAGEHSLLCAGRFQQSEADGSHAGINTENFHAAPLSYLSILS